MKPELWINGSIKDVSEAKDGSCLECEVEFLFGKHVMTMLRVDNEEIEGEEGPLQVPESSPHSDIFWLLQEAYPGPCETVRIPGYRGEYVTFMRPCTTEGAVRS